MANTCTDIKLESNPDQSNAEAVGWVRPGYKVQNYKPYVYLSQMN